MQISKTITNAQKLITLAENEGWSEEELAKVINLLHSSFEMTTLSPQEAAEIMKRNSLSFKRTRGVSIY